MARDLTRSQGEGQTPIEDLSGLLLDIKTQKELNDAESKNNSAAHAKYLLFMKPSSKFNPFTYPALLEIHKDMFGEVWSWAGTKRVSEKNLGVPVHQIGSEIQRLLFDFHQWEEKKMPPFEVAARLHHRLVQIHPFENGNGRWARLAANIYLHRKGWPVIEWPKDQKFVKEIFKPKYLSALKDADRGDYKPLTRLHQESSDR